MATRFAVATGNWSAVSTWDGLAAKPATGDTVVANGFTVTIDEDITVVQIRTLTLGAAASGGGFSVTAGARSITAAVLAGTTTCLTCSHNTGTVTITGDITGSTASSAAGVSFTGTGTVAVVGNCTGGASANAHGMTVSAASTVAVTGNLFGANGNNQTAGLACLAGGNATVTVTGNATGSSANANAGAAGFLSQATGSVFSITGTVTGSSGNGISNSSTGTVTVTGDVAGGAGNAGAGIGNSSTGSVTVTGAVNGGSNANAHGISNSSTGNVAVKGNVTAGSALGAQGILSTSTGQVHVEGDQVGVGTGAQAGTVAIFAKVLAIYSIATRKAGFAEAAGAMPGTPTGYSGALNYLYGASNAGSQSGQAAVADVRKNTVYGPTSNLTGLAYIPAAGSVATGVNVDQTVGSATLTAQNVRDAIGLASANLDTQFTALPAAVWAALTSALTTVGSIGKLLVDNINATIASRLASGSYTAPDNSGIATAASAAASAATSSASAASAAASAATSASAIQTILSGITSLAQWLGLIAGKQTGNTPARTELRATGAGSGTFDETTDSQEALRDRGDAAWADSGTPPTAADIAAAVRDVSNSSPAAGSLGEAARNADAKAAVLILTIGAPANGTVSADIANVALKTDTIPASPAAVGSPMTLESGERNSIADAYLDRTAAVDGKTPRQIMRGMSAAELGNEDGTGDDDTGTVTYDAIDGSKPRISADIVAGKRAAVTLDLD